MDIFCIADIRLFTGKKVCSATFGQGFLKKIRPEGWRFSLETPAGQTLTERMGTAITCLANRRIDL